MSEIPPAYHILHHFLQRSPVFILCFLLFFKYSDMARNSQSVAGGYMAILFTFVSSIIISDYIGVFLFTEGHSKQRHQDVAWEAMGNHCK